MMRVAATQKIAAPAEKVWQAISAPGHLEQCHPFCASNPVEHWPGPESRDEINYLSGLVYQRRFREWHEGTGYDLDILHKERLVANVSWRIRPIDNSNCVLRIQVTPKAIDRYPAAIRWLPYLVRIRPMLRSYLKSVTRGFEWFVTRGESVPRNQFGAHPWFSAMKL